MEVPAPRPAAAAAVEKPRSLATSVLAGVVLAVVVLVSVALGPVTFFMFAFGVIMLGQAELYAVLRSAGHRPAVALGLVGGAAVLLSAFVGGLPQLTVSLVVSLIAVVAWSVRSPDPRSTVAFTSLGVVYGPFLAAFAVLLLREPHGNVLAASFIGMTAVFDSGGYLVGRKLGRHRMSPKTSPKKSWEGFVGGVVVCVALSVVIMPLFDPFDVWLAFRLALVIAVVSPLGDLAESLIKRDLGVKDMGSLLPGHGGMFDRVDAIVFNAPIAYFVLVVLGWART